MRFLVLLIKVIAVSAPLTWLWLSWGREAYGRLFLELAMPVYGAFGLTTLIPEGARDRFINYLPFLILMLITPRLTLKRRVLGTLLGFLVIFAAQLVFVYLVGQDLSGGAGLTPSQFERIVPANALSDSLPFVLWILIAREFVWENVSKVLRGPPSGPQAAHSGEAEKK